MQAKAMTYVAEGGEVTCPECGQVLRVPEGLGGVTMACPECGHAFFSAFKVGNTGKANGNGHARISPRGNASPKHAETKAQQAQHQDQAQQPERQTQQSGQSGASSISRTVSISGPPAGYRPLSFVV